MKPAPAARAKNTNNAMADWPDTQTLAKREKGGLRAARFVAATIGS
jgi:hypothetical protein